MRWSDAARANAGGSDAGLVRQMLGQTLLQQRGRQGGRGVRWLTRFVSAIVHLLDRQARIDAAGPDGTRVAITKMIWPGARAWTVGNLLLIAPPTAEQADELALTVIHEYVHALQFRAEGLRFLPRYARRGLWRWDSNTYELQAVEVEMYYRRHRALSPPWALEHGAAASERPA